MIKQAAILCSLIGGFILFTQISCQKTVAQANEPVRSANVILYSKSSTAQVGSATDSSGNPILTSTYDFYLANIDGTNQRKIPIALPAGLYVMQEGYLTADGHAIVFSVRNNPPTQYPLGWQYYIYSCSIDGSNLKKLIDIDNSTRLINAY